MTFAHAHSQGLQEKSFQVEQNPFGVLKKLANFFEKNKNWD